MGHLMRQITENGIVLEQVRQRLRVGYIVNRHNLDILVTERRAIDIAADTAESVDAYFNGHDSSVRAVNIAVRPGKRATARQNRKCEGEAIEKSNKFSRCFRRLVFPAFVAHCGKLLIRVTRSP